MKYQRHQSNYCKYYKYVKRPKGKCKHSEGGNVKYFKKNRI